MDLGHPEIQAPGPIRVPRLPPRVPRIQPRGREQADGEGRVFWGEETDEQEGEEDGDQIAGEGPEAQASHGDAVAPERKLGRSGERREFAAHAGQTIELEKVVFFSLNCKIITPSLASVRERAIAEKQQ